MQTFMVKVGKSPDEMTFDECMAHIKRVLFWDYIDGEWCDVVPLSDRRWDELAGYIRDAHEREVEAMESRAGRMECILQEVRTLLINVGADDCVVTVVTGDDTMTIDGADIIGRIDELGIEVNE